MKYWTHVKDLMIELLPLFGFILLGVISIISIYFRFKYPELTETQLFLKLGNALLGNK